VRPAPGSLRVRAAWSLAIAADFAQIVVFPLFAPGFASPFDDVLDVGVGLALLLLLGPHWSFLPAFFAELVPGFDLVPTWTASVFLATRRHAPDAEPAPPMKNVTPLAPRGDKGPETPSS